MAQGFFLQGCRQAWPLKRGRIPPARGQAQRDPGFRAEKNAASAPGGARYDPARPWLIVLSRALPDDPVPSGTVLRYHMLNPGVAPVRLAPGLQESGPCPGPPDAAGQRLDVRCRGHRDQRRNPHLPVRCGEPADQDNERRLRPSLSMPTVPKASGSRRSQEG